MKQTTTRKPAKCFNNNNSFGMKYPKRTVDNNLNLDEPPQAVIDDLYFVCVASLDERQTRWWERIMTYLERAYWRYDDHWRKTYPNLRKMRSMKEFARMMFERVENLQPHRDSFDEIFRSWMAYKRSIRQSGAILLNKNMDKVLLVKGPGNMPWGMPKGKCEKQEVLQPHLAAIREVREETGFDITKNLQNKHKIVRRSGRGNNGGDLVMYVIMNVPEDYPFDSECKAEVAQVAWHKIESLPNNRSSERIKDSRSGREIKYGRGLRSLVEPLRNWIHKFQSNPSMDTLVETTVLDADEQAANDEGDDTCNGASPSSDPTAGSSSNPHFDVPQLQLQPFKSINSNGNVSHASQSLLSPFKIVSSNGNIPNGQQSSSPKVRASDSLTQQQFKSIQQASEIWSNFKLDTELVMQCIDKACAAQRSTDR
eukprot:TRINITY_DN4476_c0_g1_i4.p1 TRINITY_DN4476_c0_g1~~TRINITY_DN4476_c0_g1_i4.p1  ORF type:complete len:425 (+),score=37.36 TRINITY_DN4476_c0_g1_i4:97-1371(+)